MSATSYHVCTSASLQLLCSNLSTPVFVARGVERGESSSVSSFVAVVAIDFVESRSKSEHGSSSFSCVGKNVIDMYSTHCCHRMGVHAACGRVNSMRMCLAHPLRAPPAASAAAAVVAVMPASEPFVRLLCVVGRVSCGGGERKTQQYLPVVQY